MTRRHVIFKSSAFNTTEVRDYFINDCCFGDDVAQWIIERMRERGVGVESPPRQEDFGWYVRFHVGDEGYNFIISYRPAEHGPGDWMCGIERAPKRVLGFLRLPDSREINPQAADTIDRILTASPQITAVRWYTDTDLRSEQSGGA